MSDIIKAADAAVSIDEAIERGIIASQMAGKMSRAIAVGSAMADIRAALTDDIMKPIMALQGSSVGFKADRIYPVDVVRDALIEATIAGVYPVGNEFNIIAGRAYITKEGMGRKLRDIAGLSYTITPGIPAMKDGGAVVPMNVEWTFAGKSDKRDLPVCVKVNGGMGADAVIGKATRKARAWLYHTVTGNEIPDGEAEPVEINVTPKKSPFEKSIPHPVEKSAVATTPEPTWEERFLAACEIRGISRCISDAELRIRTGGTMAEHLAAGTLSKVVNLNPENMAESIAKGLKESAQ